MNKKIFIIAFVAAFIPTYIYHALSNAKIITSEPEPGITCVITTNMWGDKIPTGCYRGNVFKPGNKLDVKATKTYQPKSFVLNEGIPLIVSILD